MINFVRVTTDGSELDHVIRRSELPTRGQVALCGKSVWPADWAEVPVPEERKLCLGCVNSIGSGGTQKRRR